MRFPFRNVVVIVVMAWLWGLGPQVHAAAGVRELPSSPEMQSAPGTDYALRTAPFAGATVTLRRTVVSYRINRCRSPNGLAKGR